MPEDNPIVTIYKYHNISSAHQLDLPYKSKCNNVHGHNYKVEMWITGSLDEHGMVVDFHHLKREVNKLDHVNINDILKVDSTAENISVFLANNILDLAPDRIKHVKVVVWETQTAYAEYQIDNSD